jgi:hypothetical protein
VTGSSTPGDHRDELRGRGLRRQCQVDVAHQVGRPRIGAGEDGERRGQARHHQRGGDAFAADVGDDEVDAAVGSHDDVVVVAADGLAGTVGACEGVAVDLRELGGQQPALDLVCGAELFVDLGLGQGFLAQAGGLELDGGQARDVAEEAEVALADGAECDDEVDVQHAEDGIADDEWRADGRTDVLDDDRLRLGEAVVLRGIDEGDDLAPLHHFVKQGLADEQIARIALIRAAQVLFGEGRAIGAEKRDSSAGGVQESYDLVENEVEQVAHGAVLEERQGQG